MKTDAILLSANEDGETALYEDRRCGFAQALPGHPSLAAGGGRGTGQPRKKVSDTFFVAVAAKQGGIVLDRAMAGRTLGGIQGTSQ